MDKQKLIECIKQLSTFGSKEYIELYKILNLVNQLDEPQKPVVPQFVADWIEVCKENLAIGLYTAMNPDFLKQWNKSDELISWSKKTRNQELFARAWLDGYEVEKEKRYLVKMKGLEIDEAYLKFQLDTKYWYMGIFEEHKHARAKHTKTELEEAGFWEVFNSPLFEVEEVKG